MDNLSVSLGDYGFAAGLDDSAMKTADLSATQLNELNKALEAGQLQGGALNNPNQTSGGALKVESLERNLKMITFRESDIRFWKRFPKAAAFNTVEEYNQLTSYGTERGGFNNEGELPEEEDSQYVRRAELVKYLGVTRSVTHPMQLVRTNVGSVFQREIQNGIMWILRKANRGLFYGDSAVVPQEWNGLYAQHMNNDKYSSLEEYYNADVVIDLRGKTLREENIEEACQVILRNFGQADLLVAPPVVMSDFATGFYSRKRINVGQGGAVQNATMGQHITKFQSMYGVIDFEYDIFAAKQGGAGKKLAASATSPKAPAVPVPDGIAPAAVVTTDGLSEFTDGVGDYFYAVSAINRYGESTLVQLGAGAITVANADDSVDLKFATGGGTYAENAYVIYRSEKDPSGIAAQTTFYPILTVPVTGTDTKRGSLANGVDGGAAGLVRDRNRFLPKTEEAILVDSSVDVIQFKQLAPLMKMDLAKLSPADRFMVLLYGTPFLYAPDKMVRFINIGRDDS